LKSRNIQKKQRSSGGVARRQPRFLLDKMSRRRNALDQLGSTLWGIGQLVRVTCDQIAAIGKRGGSALGGAAMAAASTGSGLSFSTAAFAEARHG
jgi:hypothetical protein